MTVSKCMQKYKNIINGMSKQHLVRFCVWRRRRQKWWIKRWRVGDKLIRFGGRQATEKEICYNSRISLTPSPAPFARRTRLDLAPRTRRNHYQAAGALTCARRCSEAAANAAVVTCCVHYRIVWRRRPQNRQFMRYGVLQLERNIVRTLGGRSDMWFRRYARGRKNPSAHITSSHRGNRCRPWQASVSEK